MVRLQHRILACVMACYCLPVFVHGDTIFLKDGDTIFGRFVSEDEQSIHFSQRTDVFGEYQTVVIEKSQIAEMVVNIDPVLLEKLDPDQPNEYRDLAEELMTQKTDPEARDLAMRLFVLAIQYGDSKIHASCFSGLIYLSNDQDEEKQIRALANIMVPQANQSWLSPVESSSSNRVETDDRAGQLHQLAEALKQLRSEQRREAAVTLSKPWMDDVMLPFSVICDGNQLRSWAMAAELETESLARILELEIAIAQQLDRTGNAVEINSQPSAADRQDWSKLAVSGKPIRPPATLANLTRFDPGKPWFRNGQWVAMPSGR